MIAVTINGHNIEYYDAIEDLPIKRYHKYNKMLMLDAGIGSDLFDADGHIERAMRYLSVNRPQDAMTEMANLRHNLAMIQGEISPRMRAFAALIVSIDGVKYDDISDKGIENIINALADTSVYDITATLEAVKKKISDELKAYFPKLYDNADVKEFYTLIKKRTLSILNSVINNEDNTEEIEKVTTSIITFGKPTQFNGESNAEIACDKDFEIMCHYITENTGTNAKELSVLEFYTAYEYVNDKLKAREKALKSQGRGK